MHSDDFRLITGSQLRAARALLRWSRARLAESSQVAPATITQAEAEDGPISVTAARPEHFAFLWREQESSSYPRTAPGWACAWPSATVRRTRAPSEQLNSENDG